MTIEDKERRRLQVVNSNALKGLIVTKGLTQKQVAKKLKMTPKTFSLKLKKGVFGSDEIEKMIIETKRAELIHWISILPVIIFNKGPRLVKYINIFYAMIANVPIIIVQRYNRPRLTQLLRILKRRGERHD